MTEYDRATIRKLSRRSAYPDAESRKARAEMARKAHADGWHVDKIAALLGVSDFAIRCDLRSRATSPAEKE